MTLDGVRPRQTGKAPELGQHTGATLSRETANAQ